MYDRFGDDDDDDFDDCLVVCVCFLCANDDDDDDVSLCRNNDSCVCVFGFRGREGMCELIGIFVRAST